MRAAVAAVAMIFALTPAAARSASPTNIDTVGELREACGVLRQGVDGVATEEQGQRAIACLNFVKAVVQSSQLTSLVDGGKPIMCPPEKSGAGQWSQIFLKWADEHPEEWHRAAPMGVLLSVPFAFPCPKP